MRSDQIAGKALREAVSIEYHDVSDQAGPTGGAWLYRLARPEFEAHLRSIQERECRVCHLGDGLPVRDVRPVLLTFDDGFRSALDTIADMLEGFGWRGHFFIVTDWIGRAGYLDRNHIRELAGRGHVIGTHSCSHPERMSSLDASSLVREWAESRAVLAAITNDGVRTGSVPNGYYSRAVAEAAAQAGLETLFTSEPTVAVREVNGCLVIGRYAVKRGMKAEVSGAIASGAGWPRAKQAIAWSARKMLKGLLGESYISVRKRILQHC